MSVSQVQIVNLALLKFGNISIQAITDATPQARVANTLWDIIRDEVLYSYPWNFALKRETLSTPSVVEPEFGFDYKFILPTDCLRVWELSETDADWTVEGGELYTSNEECNVRYIAKITDVSLFTPAFITCFATRLAAELCPRLSDNKSLRAALIQEFDGTIRQAYKLNAIEGNPPRHKDEQDLSKGNLSWQTFGR